MESYFYFILYSSLLLILSYSISRFFKDNDLGWWFLIFMVSLFTLFSVKLYENMYLNSIDFTLQVIVFQSLVGIYADELDEFIKNPVIFGRKLF